MQKPMFSVCLSALFAGTVPTQALQHRAYVLKEGGSAIEKLAGDGTAKLECGVLSVEIHKKLGNFWLKIR